MGRRKYTAYPSYTTSPLKKKKEKEIKTVGDLKEALSQFPDDYPIHLFADLDDRMFINGIYEYDDECQIELL